MRILVLGASGMLGSNIFVNLSSNASNKVLGTSSLKTSIPGLIPFEPNAEQLAKLCEENNIELVINCIAIANIEKCEIRPEAAWILNADFPRLVAEYCHAQSIPFIHISTDHFYSELGSVRNEMCKMVPLNQYGFTKLAAEKMVMNSNPNSMILRVSFLGKNLVSLKDSSLLSFMLNKLSSGQSIVGFEDVYFNPVSAKYISDLIQDLVRTQYKGILHVAGEERMSKFEFAVRLAEKLNLDRELITMGSSNSLPKLVTRPKDLTLDISKLKTLFRLENVDQALNEVIE
jgi:dTDP-4-dehydrorhamnose reductase